MPSPATVALRMASRSASALAASPWGAYVTDVYGEVPQGASYPWCVYACSMLVFPSVPVRVHDQPYGRTHLSVGLLADVFGASQHIHPPACRSTPTPRVLYLFPGPLPAGAWATSGRSTRTAFRLTASRRPKASALAPLDRMQNPLLNCIRSTTSSSRQTSSGFGTSVQPFPSNTWVEVIHMKFVGDEHVGAWMFHARAMASGSMWATRFTLLTTRTR